MNQNTIELDRNVINVSSISSVRDMRSLLRALHVAIIDKKFDDVHLDFSQCEKAFARAMLPIVAQVVAYRERYKTEFYLKLPENEALKKLFENTNWAHYIRPSQYKTIHDGDRHVPVMRFRDETEMEEAIKSVIDVILSNIEGITLKQMEAFEWSLGEITDNVLNHAKSEIGGFVQATNIPKFDRIEFVVADPGMGIPASLDMVGKGEEALEYAVSEGGTRNNETNSGNGLFGSLRIAVGSGGEFHLYSQCASLDARSDGDKEDIRYKTYKVPYSGTVVISQTSYKDEESLQNALRFKGVVHEPPCNYMELKYEKTDSEDMEFLMKQEASSFRSREGGRQTRVKIKNLLNQKPRAKMAVSFNDVNVITSSFADEVFGKLFAEMGPVQFMKRIDIVDANSLIEGLIGHAITQRTSIEFKRNNGDSLPSDNKNG